MTRASLLLLLLTAAPLSAQTATPEATAEQFGRAILTSDWAQAARLMHPTALSQFRTLMEPMVSSSSGTPFMQQLFSVGSAAEFASTPDTVLFRRLLENTTKASGISGALSGGKIQALGHIAQPGDTMLVVSRMTLPINEVTITSYELIPVLLYKGQYRCLLKADITNLANMLKAQLKRES